MFGVTKEILESLREEFPEGTRVELVKMEDERGVPAGTYGTVQVVDDIGTIHVAWDNGSTLGVAYGEDECRKILTEKIKKQILAIRDTGLTNMLDALQVQRLANERNFFELVVFIEEHKDVYVNFIFTGK